MKFMMLMIAEAKEVVGGYWLIEVGSQEEAVE